MTMRNGVVLLLLLSACAERRTEFPVAEVIPLAAPADSLSREPYLFAAKDGTIGLSWTATGDGTNRLMLSFLQEDRWSEPATIASGTGWFVNWADYPMVASDGSGFVAHHLQKSGEGKFAYDVKVSVSNDASLWTEPYTLHDDSTQSEHGFVSFAAADDGYFVSWLDGRKTVMEGMEGMDHHDGHHGEMTLRAARLGADGSKLEEWELDSRVCDCCQTSMAMAASGPVAVYRDRSKEEIRDISVVRWTGSAWSQPVPVFADDWKIEGCPVNGPRIDARGDTVVVAWYSAPEGKPQVKAAFSFDGGASFSQPMAIDEGAAIGRVDVVLMDGMAVVSWMEGPEIKAVFVGVDGSRGKSFLVATSSDARASGFPQMACAGGNLFFAWTDSESKSIRVAKAQL